ncbi:MAG: HAD-IIB family hydrolase [Chitinivibrionales bacterium]|nr:HAD-IIB family hydrolase [Chitinivibrionales bacterium]
MHPLYISDLDGTLLDTQAKLTPFAFNTLKSLLLEKVPITIASARSAVSMKLLLGELPIQLPVITFNGSCIDRFDTGEHIRIFDVDAGFKHEIYACVCSEGFAPFVSAFDGKRDNLYYEQTINAGMEWYLANRVEVKDHRLRNPVRLISVLDEFIISINVIGKRDALKVLQNELTTHYNEFVQLHLFDNLYSPGWSWLTIHDCKATKDQAIKEMMIMEGLYDHELVAFGDNDNDIAMFELADRAVAVANSSPGALAAADEVIGPHDQDSVVKYLLKDARLKAAGA